MHKFIFIALLRAALYPFKTAVLKKNMIFSTSRPKMSIPESPINWISIVKYIEIQGFAHGRGNLKHVILPMFCANQFARPITSITRGFHRAHPIVYRNIPFPRIKTS
jgi:hypothetical protein